MPLYNKEDDVAASVRSVLMQTVPDFELIVVDDGSTDSGPEIVRKIKDPRIRMVYQNRSGVSLARNRGIEESGSQFIVFLDADDIWDSDFLETLLRLRVGFPGCEVYATNYRYLLPGGSTRPTTLYGVPPRPWEGELMDYFRTASEFDHPLWTSAVGVTKSAIDSVGGFPSTLHVSEDLVTWARLAIRYSIAYSAAPKATFRLRGSMYGVKRDHDLDIEAGWLLESLMTSVDTKRTVSLKGYLSSWYRKRASYYLQTGRPAKAKEEIRNMRRFQEPDLRYRIYFLLSMLPPTVSAKLAKGLNLINALRRHSSC